MANDDCIVNVHMQQCSQCKQIKPATLEFFFKGDKKKNDGLTYACKECIKIKQAIRRRDRGVRERRWTTLHEGFKICTQCKIEYPATLEFFTPHKRGIYGLTGQCRACARLHQRERYQNPEIRKRINEERQKRRFEGETKEKERKYRQRDRQAGLIRTARRRAHKKSLPENFTTSDWQRALGYFSGCCAVCGRPPGLWHTIAADHWIPLSSADCPGTIPTNIVPLCHGVGGCNNSKNKHNAAEWLTVLYGPRKAAKILARIEAYFDSLKDDANG